MVMDRFGIDLQKKFEENGKKFPRKLVLQLGLRLVGFLNISHKSKLLLCRYIQFKGVLVTHDCLFHKLILCSCTQY